MTYHSRKKEELILLNNYAKSKYNCEEIDCFDFLKKKEKMVKKMKENNAKKYYHELTNKSQIKFDDEFNYEYTYERFNGFLEVKNFTNRFYNIDNKVQTYNYFTNCGMSAIVATLLSIASNNIDIELMYEETYFETIKFINAIFKNQHSDKILYLDSIASDFNFDERIEYKKYKAIIIDTTCFIGDKYKELIEKIVSSKKLCILVRSHTKLDLIGTEYSHIGSVSFVYPINLKEEETDIFNKIRLDCHHLIGVIGACLTPEKFPSFILDKNLTKLNKERIKQISRNNALLFNACEKLTYHTTLPNHQQFCLINFKNSKKTLKELKKDIISYCKKIDDIPIYHAVSFGFDYIAVDCYDNFMDGSFKIRISMSDIEEKEAKKAIVHIIKLLEILTK